ncbi:hypothetical protein ACWC9U_35425 [Streptomyces sp. 900116325]
MYLIGVQASSAIASIATRMDFFTATARENRAPAARQTAATLWEKYTESARSRDSG